MKTRKISLNALKVKSFVTLNQDGKNDLKGGRCTNNCSLFCQDTDPRTRDFQDCCEF
ncbi:MAG: pinensin family lanthipeptide [Cyclobacteriaceae bacterium]